ncbi:MAG: hypothetical protein ABI852_03600 [Gemmatimonadaceae bacterium]
MKPLIPFLPSTQLALASLANLHPAIQQTTIVFAVNNSNNQNIQINPTSHQPATQPY